MWKIGQHLDLDDKLTQNIPRIGNAGEVHRPE